MTASRRTKRERLKAKRGENAPAMPRTTKRVKLTVIDEKGAAAIHGAVLRILSEIGVLIDDDATRRMLVQDHGCRQDEEGYVHLPEDLVQRSLETLGDQVRLFDRDGRQVVDTSDRIPRFCPGHNCVQILDHRTGEHRPGVRADLENTSRVCEALPNIDMACSLGYPGDVPVENESIETVKALTAHCKKPVAFTGHDEVKVEQIWSYLAELVGGWGELADKPCGLDLTGPVSPLKLGEETCRRLEMSARRWLPMVCYPAIFPGMAGPITLAGSIAQSSAEALAGVVIHQIHGPGAPILSGSAILPMDMRRADLAYGSPEYALAGLGAADYFSYIGLPSWTGAGCSDSHTVDLQAAAEVGSNMSMAALAGTAFIHNLGFLSGGRTGSLEMLVLCNELAGMVAKLGGGIVVDEESLAVDVIKRSAAENAFLTDSHTFDRYQTEMWIPRIFERSDLSIWLESGAPSIRERLQDKLHSILS